MSSRHRNQEPSERWHATIYCTETPFEDRNLCVKETKIIKLTYICEFVDSICLDRLILLPQFLLDFINAFSNILGLKQKQTLKIMPYSYFNCSHLHFYHSLYICTGLNGLRQIHHSQRKYKTGVFIWERPTHLTLGTNKPFLLQLKLKSELFQFS